MNDVAAAVAVDARTEAQPPVWNLSDLYGRPDAVDLDRDLKQALQDARAFRAEFENKLTEIPGAGLGEAISRYEAIFERLNKAMSFAQLYFAADMADPARGRFLQTLQERYNAVSAETLFFTLELNKLSDEDLDAKRDDPVV
ncbi:MAG: M3 family oligoendopeptidase, partial [Rhodospirillales bacterium]